MTVATVLLTSLLFLAVGWTGIEHRVLFSSGLIAGGAIVGVGIAALQALRKDEFITITHWLGAGAASVTESAIVAIACYVLLLAIPLYRVARRPHA